MNLESWFARAAQDFLREDLSLALRTFEVTNANPLLSVVGITPFLWLFGPAEAVTRMFSLVCAAGTIIVIGTMSRREFGAPQGVLAAILAALNPVLWTWGGQAYSDGPFVLLISASLALTCAALRSESDYLHVCSAVLLGLAFLTKYNAVAAYAGTILSLLAVAWHQRKSNALSWGRLLRVIAIYVGIGLLIGGAYLLWVFKTMGHILAPSGAMAFADNMVHLEYVWVFGIRLAACLMWLGIFVGPLALLYIPALFQRRMTYKLFVSVGIVLMVNNWLVGQIGEAQALPNFGELQLGWLANVGHPALVRGLAIMLLTVGEITLFLLLRWRTQQPVTTLVFKVWLITMLLVHASVRPTNRYLLFFVPVLAPFLADLVVSAWTDRPRLTAAAVAVSVVLFLGLGMFNSAYFAAEGRAAAAIARYVNEHRLAGIPNSPIHPVMSHNFYLIDPQLLAPKGSPNTTYDLAAFLPHQPLTKNVIHAEEVRLMGVLLKRYTVVQITAGTG